MFQLADAIHTLETRMLKEDCVKPDHYIYNLIIGECGRLGYSKKAFQLYNQVCDINEREYEIKVLADFLRSFQYLNYL
jgi:pentatricopeptide repeat protein